jgi:hypothetical protein
MISTEWHQRPGSYASGLRFRELLLAALRAAPQPVAKGRGADGRFFGRRGASARSTPAPTINAQGEVTGMTIDLAA